MIFTLHKNSSNGRFVTTFLMVVPMIRHTLRLYVLFASRDKFRHDIFNLELLRTCPNRWRKFDRKGVVRV
jgi:hypothetical protein